jgi:hypothetical protein
MAILPSLLGRGTAGTAVEGRYRVVTPFSTVE